MDGKSSILQNNKSKEREKEGKFYHLTQKENPLKNNHIFRNHDWVITVTTNGRGRVAGSQKYPI